MNIKKQFITATREFCTREKHVNAPLFRKVFDHDGESATPASIEIAVAGFYRLFLNGEELTKGYFAPYISNPEDYVYTDTYDVTGKLNRKNVLCVLLGNGFNNSMDCGVWDFETAPHRSAPKMWLELTVDGKTVVETNESFTVCPSAITFDDYRCGESFDARLVKKGVLDVEFVEDESFRAPILTDAPKGEMKACNAHAVKSFEMIKPVSVTAVEGGYIYDFGQNNTGVCTLALNGREGQEITLTHGEMLIDGKLDLANISFDDRSQQGYIQCDRYICVDGYQEHTPSFTYHGFRYVFVEGVTCEQATEELLTFVVIHSDIKPTGAFSCDMPEVKRIQDCTLRSDTSNFIYFPNDCPHREKNGWTADASLSAEQLLYNFDCADSFAEWLCNIRKAQSADGALPGIVPTTGWGFHWGNGPAWDSVLIELPYQAYRFNGCKQIIKDNMGAILKYFDYLRSRLNDMGLIDIGLGDWCEAGTVAAHQFATPREVTDTLVTVDLLKKSAFMLRETGEDETAQRLLAFADELRCAFRKKYVTEKGLVNCHTQTAQAMAIQQDIFGKSDLAVAYGYLLDLVHKENDHFKVGVVGINPLLSVLAENGDAELALKLITQHSFPSYSYNVDLGATTLWEDFHEIYIENGNMKRCDGVKKLNSLNHHFWGGVSAWFYKYIVGLKIVSFDRAVISPKLLSVGSAEASYKKGERSISVKIERNEAGATLTVCSHGFRGEIVLDDYMHESGKASFAIADGETVLALKKK